MTETPVHGAFWKKGGMDMSSGQFWWGMTTGLVAGAVVGMSVACDPPIKAAPAAGRPWRELS